jgi:hypothetical protein
MTTTLGDVCFWGQIGHCEMGRQCRLMTHSGHRAQHKVGSGIVFPNRFAILRHSSAVGEAPQRAQLRLS